MKTWVALIIILISIAIFTWAVLKYQKIKRKYFDDDESEVSVGDIEFDLADVDRCATNDGHGTEWIRINAEGDKCEVETEAMYVGTAEPVETQA